jgi:hypothetical protein
MDHTPNASRVNHRRLLAAAPLYTLSADALAHIVEMEQGGPEAGRVMCGLTIRQAATQLHVTPQTVRRRLHLGELHGWTVAGKYGPEWRIVLDQDGPLAAPREMSAPVGSREELLGIIAAQARIIERLCCRRAEVTTWAAAALSTAPT